MASLLLSVIDDSGGLPQTTLQLWKSERESQFSSRQLYLSGFKTGLWVNCMPPTGPLQRGLLGYAPSQWIFHILWFIKLALCLCWWV